MDLPIRGLQKGFDTPLQDFTGVLESYDEKEETFGGKGKPKTKVTFHFKDVKVHMSSEPYNFAIAHIVVFFSGSANSSWGILAKSIVSQIPEGENLPFLVGKKSRWALTPNRKLGVDKETKEPILKDCWEVIEIEGSVSKISPTERVLDLIDGRNDAQFNQVAIGDPILKSDANLMSQLVGQTLIPALEAAGKITKGADGIYHKVK
jgi:hypothetical protein